MREIKFRAFDPITKKMVFPIHNYYDFYLDVNIDGKIRVNEIKQKDYNSCQEVIHRDDIVVMQYTGIKDKNGVEVYEGDILKDEFSHYQGYMVVKWVDWWAGFLFYSKEENNVYSDLTSTELEVIGNTYENPELLEESK